MSCKSEGTWVHILRVAKVQGYCRASGEELQTETSGPLRRAGQTQLFEAISQVIAQMGGEVIRDYEIMALLAKKG